MSIVANGDSAIGRRDVHVAATGGHVCVGIS